MVMRRTTAGAAAALVLALLVGVAALLAPSMALAQQQPDPNSPAGVEYALPLDQARDQAREKKPGKGKRGQRGAGKAAPLFGAGISKGGSGAAGSDQSNADAAPGGGSAGGSAGDDASARAGSKGSQPDGPGADGSDGSGAQAGKSGAPNAGRTAASVGDGGSQTGLLLGVVAGVLLLGGLLGAGLRRGFGRSG